MTLALGIDIGTSGVRSAVVDSGGAVLSQARQVHLPQSPDSIDATKWWIAVELCLQKQVAELKSAGIDPGAVTDIAVDGTSGSMVLTDSDLFPVTQALMYNSAGFDAEAEVIASFAPPAHICRGSNSALARALKLQSEDRAGHAAYLLHQADFVTAKLIGAGGHSDHNNTLKLGFDPETGEWPDWLPATGLRVELLPEAHPAGALVASIEPDLARSLGLSEDCAVHAGTTDSIAAFLACAPLEEGVAVTSLGTTLVVKIVSRKRIDDPEIGLYSHRLGDYWLVGGASNSGGGVLATFFSPAQLDDLSTSIDPDHPSGLDYYPLARPGERFPTNDPVLAPRLSPRPADDACFLQGMLEGMSEIERQCYAAIHDRGGPMPGSIITAGGGSKNKAWTAIRKRMINRPIANALDPEAAVGSARLALGKRLNRPTYNGFS